MIKKYFILLFRIINLRAPKSQEKNSPTWKIECFPKANVVWVIDGDTIIISRNWRQTKIRLDSIDCPEDGQYWGDQAKYGLIKLIGGQTIHFEKHGIDCYGRTLATIYVRDKHHKNEWRNVNERMVVLGHAWVMRRYYTHLSKARQNKLNHLERWARSKRIGLWHAPSPIPPWKWRNGGNKGNDCLEFARIIPFKNLSTPGGRGGD